MVLSAIRLRFPPTLAAVSLQMQTYSTACIFDEPHTDSCGLSEVPAFRWVVFAWQSQARSNLDRSQRG
jgi:hypothetical protein